MDTARVEIIYRPLRLAWLLNPGDFEGYRKIARLSNTIAGGRFNPIILVGQEDAKNIADVFHIDVIIPVSEGPDVQAFAKQFAHLIQPYFGNSALHFDLEDRGPGVRVLDITNLLTRWHADREWQVVAEFGLRTFTWDEDDPLKDAFLTEYGQFPSKEAVHFDYSELLKNAASPHPVIDLAIPSGQIIPVETNTHPSIALLGRFAITPYALDQGRGWNTPGIYAGRADALEDLVEYWNLRAANIGLRFVDDRYLDRYEITLPAIRESIFQMVAHLDDYRRRIAIWSRNEITQQRLAALAGDAGHAMICSTSEHLWNGLNLKAPRMILGSSDALGVIVEKEGKPSVSFSLADKPYSSDIDFFQQQLVVSVSMYVGSTGDDTTFQLPYLPELNETFARAMGQQYSRLRVEPGRLGIVTDAHNASVSITALSITTLIKSIFRHVGLNSKLSNAGLIARQLITQMGGTDKVRAFKIPGVRRLIRSSGLNESITKNKAYSLIGKADPDNPGANFSDHNNLFIEQRPFDSDLTVQDVFAHLIGKRIFRVGADLHCPTCNLASWLSIDDVRQEVDCTYCGAKIETPKQLLGSELTYRRSGLLGIERNLQGAVPVALVLQQLSINAFDSGMAATAYSPSLEVEAVDGSWAGPKEIDFLAIEFGRNFREGGVRIVFGEAKDRFKPFDANDVETMKVIAAAFPKEQYKIYILFAKLNQFTEAEIGLAAKLAQTHNVILLTDKELEPYHVYDRAGPGFERYTHDLDGLVLGTAALYPELVRKPPSE
jgi:hypothetical protein